MFLTDRDVQPDFALENLEPRLLLAADIVIDWISYQPGTYGENDNPTIVVQVRNAGDVATGAFDIDIAASMNDVFGDADDVALATFTNADLDPGEDILLTLTGGSLVGLFDVSGSYFLGSHADTGGAVAESDETNNTILSDRADFVIGPSSDFNFDGQNDVLWHNQSTGVVGIWTMDGTTKTGFIKIGDQTPGFTAVGIGDFDDDGDQDILWRNTSNGDLTLWRLNGTTLQSTLQIDGPSTNWVAGGVGDFDLDGDLDIVWRNTLTGDNGIWIMNGLRKVGFQGLPAVADSNWKIEGVADINKDGHVDLVWRNINTGVNGIWAMSGVTKLNFVGLPQVADTDWRMQGFFDFDRDGSLDILWRNTVTGQNILWLMDSAGTGKTGTVSLPRVSDLDWKMIG